MQKGGLDLAALPFDLAEKDHFEKWQRVFERVRDTEMPPAKNPQPEKQLAREFLAWLKAPLLEADRHDVVTHGRVRGRRLTRTEYKYTLHDLLGIDIPLKDLLPADRAAHGFETVAEGQQLSHHQVARYLDVADLALNEAFSRASKGGQVYRKFYAPAELAETTRGNYRGPDLRDGESLSWPIGLQFFGRMRATQVPEDGWYRVTLKGVRSINAQENGVVWGMLRSGICYSNAVHDRLVEATESPRDMVYEAWIQKDHMLELRPNDGELKRAPTGASGGNVSFKGRDLENEGFAGIAHRGIEVERIYPIANRAIVRQNLFAEEKVEPPKGKPEEVLDRLVGRFAQRAFRRPVSSAHLEPSVGDHWPRATPCWRLCGPVIEPSFVRRDFSPLSKRQAAWTIMQSPPVSVMRSGLACRIRN